jgi:nicotinamide-nucleotide amidase
MTATLLTVGDELLIGQVVNTNAAWIGEQLATHGLQAVRSVVVGDDLAGVADEVRRALRTTDVVVVTGGLGPTHDDVTKQAVAEALGVKLRFHEYILDDIRAKFEKRGRTMAAANRVQAEVPEGFEPLTNAVGTAPGLWFAGPWEGVAGERVIVLLPGVPYEMQTLMRDIVLPRLVELQGEAAVVQKTLHTAGIGESDLAEKLGDLTGWLSDRIKLAFLPSYGVVRLRLTAFGDTRAEALGRLGEFEAYVRDILGDLVFGEGDETLASVLGAMLVERGLTLATAESCTGGRLADAITDVPGSSVYFSGGVVVYGNPTKEALLEVGADALRAHGAVSEPVARQMAEGVRQRLGASIGVSATGIAGPGGGTRDKPVGTVWLGYADEAGSHTVRLQLPGDRQLNKRLSVTAALNLVRRQLLQRDELVGA